MNAAVVALAGGAAHGLVFAIFALAAIGKLLGCSGGVRSLCGKAAYDALLAGLVLVPWLPAQLACGALALATGLGGWALERLRGSAVCRCFGLLNRALHVYRNLFRAGLALGGTLLAAVPADVTNAATWQGAAAALAAVLLLATAALGRTLGGRGAAGAAPQAHTVAALAPGLEVGASADGRAVTLGELRRGEAPLAILLSLPQCAECDTVKADLAPLRPALPFPLVVLERGAPGGQAGALADARATLARQLGIARYPALVVVDPRGWTVAGAIAFGTCDIRKRMLQAVLGDIGFQRPAASRNVHAVTETAEATGS